MDSDPAVHCPILARWKAEEDEQFKEEKNLLISTLSQLDDSAVSSGSGGGAVSGGDGAPGVQKHEGCQN